MKILALDFEGTHREPRRGCPIQIGVAVMEDGEVYQSDEFLIRPPRHYKSGKPTREVDAYALAVSGLTLEQVEADGLTCENACKRLVQFVNDHDAYSLPVVSFNIGYDYEMYGLLLLEGGKYDFHLKEYLPYAEILSPRWICAARLSRQRLADRLIKFTLDDVAKCLGMERTGEVHGALEDAILAGRIYSKFVQHKELAAS